MKKNSVPFTVFGGGLVFLVLVFFSIGWTSAPTSSNNAQLLSHKKTQLERNLEWAEIHPTTEYIDDAIEAVGALIKVCHHPDIQFINEALVQNIRPKVKFVEDLNSLQNRIDVQRELREQLHALNALIEENSTYWYKY